MLARLSLKTILALLFLGIIIASIFLTIFLVRQRQEIRKRAAVPEGEATVSLSPATGTHQVNQSFSVSIYFNTANIAISAIAVRITYPFTGTTPELTASGIQINPSLLSTGDWSCPVKTIAPEGGTVRIDIACINTSVTGFSTSTDTLLASFSLITNQVPATNPTVLRFDPSQSIITRKSDGRDVLLIPTSTGSYTISNGASPSPSPTSSSSPTPAPTPSSSPSPSASPSPTPTPTPGGQGGPVSTPTPTPSSITSTTTISSPPVGATVTTAKPTISGETVPNATVAITINSPTITGSTTADSTGNWSYTPTTALANGTHTVTITARDPTTGETVTKTSSLVVAAGTTTATTGGEIVAGNFLPTLFILGVGLLFLILSLVPKIL